MTAIILNGESFELNDFLGLGHEEILPAGYGRPAESRFPDRIFAQFLTTMGSISGYSTAAAASATAAAASATAAAGSATAASSSSSNASTFATNAANSATLAAAAAASADFPFATTAGTSTAYTLDFTPDRTVADGFIARVNFHTACGAAPTLSVDGTTAHEIVDGLNLSSGGAYRSLTAGDIFTGMNLIIQYDSSVSKFVICGGFPIYKLSRDLNAAGFNVVNVRGYNSGLKSDGALANGALTKKVYFPNATRLYNIKHKLSTGTITVVLSKNGATNITFGAGPSANISATNAFATLAVNISSNAYLDFAQGDYILVTLSANSAASDLLILFDAQENYQ